MDFLFFYELKYREIETLALLKCELERRGYTCAISHFSAWGYGWNMFHNPKVIVTPWLRNDENVYTFTRNVWKTKKIVNLQCEQIYSDEDVRIGNAVCTGLARKAYHLCWGKISQDRLFSYGVPIDHLPITGCIKMDYFLDGFSVLFKNRKQIADEYYLNIDKKWVLFISSLAFASYDPNDLEYLYQKSGDFSDFVEIHIKTRNELLAWVANFLSENEDVEFIYRTHPSENIDDVLREHERNFSSFHIIAEDSLQQWIYVADIIDVWYTTGVGEIFYSGKVCNVLRPVEIPEKYEMDFYKGGEFVKTYVEFVKAHLKVGEKFFPIDSNKILNTYDQSEIPSYIRTADVLQKVFHDKNVKMDFYTTLSKQNYHTFRQYLKSMVGDFVRVFNFSPSKYFKKDSYMYKVFAYIEEKALGINEYISLSCDKMGKILKNEKESG